MQTGFEGARLAHVCCCSCALLLMCAIGEQGGVSATATPRSESVGLRDDDPALAGSQRRQRSHADRCATRLADSCLFCSLWASADMR